MAEGVTHSSPPATQGTEKHECSTLAECASCIKHGFKMRFFLTVFAQRRRLRRVQSSAYPPELLFLMIYGCSMKEMIFILSSA